MAGLCICAILLVKGPRIFLLLSCGYVTDSLTPAFSQHITAEGTVFVQQAEDAASSQVHHYDCFLYTSH